MTACYFTADGLVRFRHRLDDARAAYRAVCDDNPAAAESGDSSVWHDNFAYEENQRKMQMLARRVREFERVLERAVVVEAPLCPDCVALATRVTYRIDDETAKVCTIAGWDDGDSGAGRISYNSPFGSELIGLRPGQTAEVQIAGRERVVEVVEVAPLAEVECAGC